jgi:hypothetical protein
MSVSHKKPPRFIPTLTEVIVPTDPAAPAAPAAPRKPEPVRSRKSAARNTPVTQEVVERVMQQLTPLVESRLRELIAPLMQEQMDMFAQDLTKKIDQLVQQAVAKRAAQEFGSTRRR